MSLVRTLCEKYHVTEGQADMLIERLGASTIEQILLSGKTTKLYREVIVVKRLTAALTQEGYAPDMSGVKYVADMLDSSAVEQDPLNPVINVLLKSKS